MKNIKKVFVLFLFLVLIIGIIAPVNAKLTCEAGTYTLVGNDVENKVYLNVWSDIGTKSANPGLAKYVSKRKAELNKVNKIVLKISGYKTVTFKKPTKGWKNKDYNNIKSRIIKEFSVEKHLNGKNYSIKLYDKKGKVIKKGKGKLTGEVVFIDYF